ncbi:unnamed protein product [Symbiodinium necroappetens]|uniref:Uncharacterized protein n=1 Tax=Symbiodinium necroappetens TaxID=1628268 RepID=A0A812ZBN6_9DINO|nr:unnamed protein product [Symbiodinium necroappetens]
MSGAKMTKAELQKRLQMLGETPPAGWTKVQLASRLAEISEESETTLSERDAAKMVNKCKTKVALQELLTEHQVYYTKHQNSDQLKSSMLKYLMENKVPASENNYMGFGKHSQLTYGETLVFMPAYVEWCVTTAAEEPECHWRLRRFARWVQGLGEGEKKEITKRIQIEHHGSPPKKSYAATSASSSTTNNENKWEMVSDLEMIPAEANDQSSKIRELENELRQLRDMIQAKTETDKELSSARKKANRNDEL